MVATRTDGELIGTPNSVVEIGTAIAKGKSVR